MNAAARLGAEVTLIERDVVGGAAHLWDCIPSKAMIATAGAMGFIDRSTGMGLSNTTVGLDIDAIKGRIAQIEAKAGGQQRHPPGEPGVRLVKGTGRFVDANHVEITPADGTPYTIEADVALVSTRVRRWTGRMDWSDTAGSRARLEATNAFLDANDAEDRGFHLLDPVTDNPALNSRTPDCSR